MSLSVRRLIVPAALALTLVAPACGSDEGPKDVPADAIAVVGDTEIPKAEFDRLIKQAEASYKTQGQEFPQPGSPEYENLKNAIVSNLVERAQFEQEAEEMNIEVTDEDVEKRLDELKQQFFQGDEEKYRQEIEKQGLTDEQVREEIRSRVLSEKLFEAVTKDVKVTDQDVQDYYEENKAQFQQAESREVRHILVKSKANADELYGRLRAGADFAKLAREFSQDSTSAAQGGKLTAQKGQTVAPFDQFVFSAETGDLSQPVKTEFGWHIIEILGDTKAKTVTPLADVEQSIRDTLLREKQNEAMRDWVNDLKAEYADQIAYAPGFAPPATTTDETTTTGE